VPVATIYRQPSGNYAFLDQEAENGTNAYRLKIIAKRSKAYTNIVTINRGIKNLVVYPNPVKNRLSISFKGNSTNYKLQLINISGQVIYQEKIKNVTSLQYHLDRTSTMKPGIYLLKLISDAGDITIQKLLFE
jgi:hypothetical protein